MKWSKNGLPLSRKEVFFFSHLWIVLGQHSSFYCRDEHIINSNLLFYKSFAFESFGFYWYINTNFIGTCSQKLYDLYRVGILFLNLELFFCNPDPNFAQIFLLLFEINAAHLIDLPGDFFKTSLLVYHIRSWKQIYLWLKKIDDLD